MPLDFRSPGLQWRKRPPLRVAYWICRADIAKNGYPTKTARLWSGPLDATPTADEMEIIRRECFRLQGEMREWNRVGDKRASRRFRAPGRVYFVRSGDLIKIGFAQNVNERISDLRTASASQIHLIVSIRGSRYSEQCLHWQFRPSRERGEWFRETDDLRAFIEAHVDLEPTVNPFAIGRQRRQRAEI